METQQNPPLGQPTTPNTSDPQYVPQPLTGQDGEGKPKRWLLVVAAALVVLALLGGLIWWQGKDVETVYQKQATTYQQDIKRIRDGMNKKLDTKDISPSSGDARPIFENYGKQLQAAIAKAPKAPKILGVIPASVDSASKKSVEEITKAATAYATYLRSDAALYDYYLRVTTAFKPIHDLDIITAFHREKVMTMGEQWPRYQTILEATKPPTYLKTMHDDLVAQSKVIGEKVKTLTANFDTNSFGTNDQLLSELSPLTDKLNKTFADTVSKRAETSFKKVNDAYDALDAKL